MSKSKIIVAANIGLAVSKKKDSRSNLYSNNRHETFREVHDALTEVYNKYSQNPNIFCVQELGYMTFKPAPFFGNAAASDFKTVINSNGEARGVGIYSRNPDTIEVDTENDTDEICAIIDTYKDRNNRISKFAVINVYRLQHKENNRTIQETVEAIDRVTKIIRNKYEVRKMIVLGDFNDEDPIYLQRGFTELKNPANFHKHTTTSRKTYIDRVFTNFEDVGYLDVMRRFRIITDAIFKLGFMPKVWKLDNIHFLYKRKGDRSDAANWRPITIAVSLGKHVERLFSILISPMDDRNYENHAYVKKRPCMTAICEVQRHLLKAKTMANKRKFYKAVSIISADDISEAFESIEGILIAYALELIFKRDRSANLGGFIMSFLSGNLGSQMTYRVKYF